MSFPLQSDYQPSTFNRLVAHLRSTFEQLPDGRTGKTKYSMADAALAAFSVFFTQSPSFLDFQRTLQMSKGCNNAASLFGVTQVPSDNQIRNLLDPVPPSEVRPLFSAVIEALHHEGHLESYRSINGDLLVAMDGTQYFSSSTVHCPQCNVTEHRNGSITYSHTAVTPVIVAPGNPRVLPLEPEFISPQDGHKKQDCENAAAKRWLSQFGSHYRSMGITILGDDLYCKQPLCIVIRNEELNFILVCKPDSHKTLYEWIDGLSITGGVETLTIKHKKGKHTYTDTVRFVNQVPLRDGEDALDVNWCELTSACAMMARSCIEMPLRRITRSLQTT
jgi:hypothetical protein